MESVIWVNGKIVSSMVKELLHGVMEGCTKESSTKITNTAKESTHGQTENHITEAGNTTNNTAKLFSPIARENKRKEFG